MTYIDKDNLMIITASPLVGAPVKTPYHQTIGEITGIILDTITGEIPFALLSFNNNFKIKDKHIAVSWEDFENNTPVSEQFILDMKKIQWQDIPHFNSGYLPAYSQYELMDTVHAARG